MGNVVRDKLKAHEGFIGISEGHSSVRAAFAYGGWDETPQSRTAFSSCDLHVMVCLQLTRMGRQSCASLICCNIIAKKYYY